ncbi:hypothetical protein [Thiomonas sp. FB-Cd]|uniref:hypothetical protein n=1 Tax=Thiomonas sp. FB-Cd TaxID=1158292 RepID=UPI000AEB4D46|nr:hypothetical protein [Thiomonas sp. FB-Cd]
MPADFDLSPYFAIVKPEADVALDYRALPWVSMLDADLVPALQDSAHATADVPR